MSELPWWTQHLACPDCQSPLKHSGDVVQCSGCGYRRDATRQLDLRPMSPQPHPIEHPIETNAFDDLARCLVERPVVEYRGPRAARDSSELFSAVGPHLRSKARLLDLGCGPRDQAVPATYLDLEYVGVDYASPSADALADAHAIPFRDETFDLVLAYAVLEHLYDPLVAIREVARVLRPDGIFFGVMSQGEPFHDSYFHATALGLLTLLSRAGFRATQLWYSFDTLHGLATMGRYPVVIRWLLEAVHRVHVAAPFLAPRKAFRWSRRERELDALHRAAAICFTARPATPSVT